MSAAVKRKSQDEFSQPLSQRRKAGRTPSALSQSGGVSGTTESSFSDPETHPPGVIEEVHLVNFMCHENFSLKFKPRINFVIGRNGSGKSAILTAITVCLGQKASETNRGSSLKALIREGAHQAKITLILANGPGGYRPDVYGSRIVIERVIRREAPAAYSLKADSGEVISNKREELQSLLEYFAIKIDNPLAFLTQDTARSFLNSASDRAKYEHFMNGIHLTEMMRNLQTTDLSLGNIRQLNQANERRVEALRADMERQKELVERSRRGASIRAALLDTIKKQYWCEVRDWETTLATIEKSRSTVLQNVAKLTTASAEATEARDSLAGSLDGKQAELVELTKETEQFRLQRILPAAEAVKARINTREELRQELSQLTAETSRAKAALKQRKRDLQRLEAQRDALTGGSAAQLETRQREQQEALKKAEAAAEEMAKTYEEQHADSGTSSDPTVAEIEKLEAAIHTSEREITRLKDETAKVHASAQDFAKVFGYNMPAALKAISTAKGFHRRPLGPLGLLVALKPEFRHWAAVFDAVYGKTLSSFVVADAHDRNLLYQLLQRYKIYPRNILIHSQQPFDYRHGLPDPQYQTVLDALQFDSEAVKCIFIDVNNVEAALLEENRAKADSVMYKQPRNARFCFALDPHSRNGFSVGARTAGASGTTPIYGTTGAPRLRTAAGNQEELLAELAANVEAEERKIATLQEQLAKAKAELRRKVAEKKEMAAEVGRLKTEAKKIRRKLADIAEQLAAQIDDGEILSAADAVREAEENVQLYESQHREAEGKIIEAQELVREAEVSRESIEMEFEALKRRKQEKADEVVSIEMQRQQKQDELAKYETAISQREAKLAGLEAEKRETEAELARAEAAAQEKCPREEAPLAEEDTLESLIETRNDLHSQMQQFEQSIGMSAEKVSEQFEKSTLSFELAQEKWEDSKRLELELHRSLAARLEFLTETRSHACMNAHLRFSEALKVRGFEGRLQFDHQAKQLALVVKTKNDAAPRSVNSLSGGEKTITQICLLLAIWGHMKSRILALDEFDVFLDGVNREVGMRLMIDSLLQQPRTQAIFITPQDMGNVGDLLASGQVFINRMADPRRRNNSENH